MREPFLEIACPCVFAIAQICQEFVGDVVVMADGAVLDGLADRFTDTPPPQSYGEVLLAGALLSQFTKRLASELHRASHPNESVARCAFNADQYALDVQQNVERSQVWSVRTAVSEWASRFAQAFRRAHQPPVSVRARRRLQASVAHPPKVSELAHELGCSVAVLRRRFTREAGESIRDYRTRARVVKAIARLRSTDWKIEAIAADVGWQSKKNLYRAVERACGATPAAVRLMSALEADALIAKLYSVPEKPLLSDR